MLEKNPWQSIDLNVYEAHMSSENVLQLQMLNRVTKRQLDDYRHDSVAFLGVAGGNGLENIDPSVTKKVYGIDVNTNYLDACKERYPQLSGVLELVCCDLRKPGTVLPSSDILICNLIIEYMGVRDFIGLVEYNRKNVNVISCVIQKNNNNNFVSNSALSSSLEPIMAVHHDIHSEELLAGFEKAGYSCHKKITYPLPNGKEFIRMDFMEF